MIMKKYYIPLILALVISASGCRKTENIDFQFNKDLDYVPTELDYWLSGNFTNPYNMEIVYRFDRYKMGELKQNLSPAKEEKVKEQMEMIRNGFILPFEKAAGSVFSKTYFPKEWVLSGSYAVTSDGRILALSSGGRSITIYEVNTADTTNAEVTRAKLKTVHHEYAHTLTQILRIPREFESISEANYSADWRSTFTYPDAVNDAQGFVSRYSRANVMEDFAETAGFLLVYGQLWYDTRAGKIPSSGYDIMKKKEAALVKFYRDSYGVDFRRVQREMAQAMYGRFNDKQKQSFAYWFFDQGTFNYTLPYNTAVSSGDLKIKVNNFIAKAPLAANTQFDKYVVKDLNFLFTPGALIPNSSAKQGDLIIRVGYQRNTAPVAYADYTFKYLTNPAANTVKFDKSTQGTDVNQNANAKLFMTPFMDEIASYFTNGNFVPEWSIDSPSRTRLDEFFFDFGGFYKEGNRSSYINFPLQRARK